MKKSLLVLIAAFVLSISAVVLAANQKTPPPVAVAVAVDGLHCKACVDELHKDLVKVAGVTELNVTQNPGQVTAKLDESKITAGKFVGLITAHPQMMDHQKTYGARLIANIDTTMCAKQKKMCAACFTEIPKVLKGVKGVSDVTLDETGKIASIGFAKDANVSTATLAKALGKSNFKFTASFAPVATATEASADAHHADGKGHDNCDMSAGSGSKDNCDMNAGGGGACCGGM